MLIYIIIPQESKKKQQHKNKIKCIYGGYIKKKK